MQKNQKEWGGRGGFGQGLGLLTVAAAGKKLIWVLQYRVEHNYSGTRCIFAYIGQVHTVLSSSLNKILFWLVS